MLATAWAVFICVAGVVGVAWVLWISRHGDRDRHDEDAARDYFDVHGHWPDQSPDEAAEERRRMAAAAAAVSSAQVADVGEDGRV